MAGLFLGLFIGAPVGFTYAVTRRAFSDRVKAKAQVKQHGRDGWAAARGMMAWAGGAVLAVVLAVAWAAGATGPDRAAPDACASAPAPASARATGPVRRAAPHQPGRAGRTPGPGATAAAARRSADANRLSADPSPEPCRR